MRQRASDATARMSVLRLSLFIYYFIILYFFIMDLRRLGFDSHFQSNRADSARIGLYQPNLIVLAGGQN